MLNFIETWFGLSPDGGDGTTEILYLMGGVAILAVITRFIITARPGKAIGVSKLQSVLLALRSFAWLLVYEWFAAARRVINRVCEIMRAWRKRQKLPERVRKATTDRCVPINDAAFRRPDPLLYSQQDLIARGYAVTWNNPDIEIHRNGAPVNSWELAAGTEYDVIARIWNNSTEAPIIALSVQLGVKGGPDHPAFATITWRTPSESGHYCLQVEVEPVDDLNFRNNLGQENTDVRQAQSPAEFEFTLRNATQNDDVFRFEVDTYTIPDLPSCEELGEGGRQSRRTDARLLAPVPTNHDRGNYQMPAGWSLEIDPITPRLASGDKVIVHVRISPPAGFTGQKSFNINAFNEHGFAGGVSLTVDA
jgi:hypothetical protein